MLVEGSIMVSVFNEPARRAVGVQRIVSRRIVCEFVLHSLLAAY